MFSRSFSIKFLGGHRGSLWDGLAVQTCTVGDAPPIFFLRHQKENAPRPVEKKKCWCPNTAWRQVRAKTGVLAGERRIFAVRSPRWARAQVCGNFKWSARDETMEVIRGARRIGFRSSFHCRSVPAKSSGKRSRASSFSSPVLYPTFQYAA